MTHFSIFCATIFSLFLGASFLGCSRSENFSEKFLNAYIEMRIVSDMYNSRPEAGIWRKAILKKYGYSEKSFRKEADDLRSDYEIWLQFQAEVLKKLDLLIENKIKNPLPLTKDKTAEEAPALAKPEEVREEDSLIEEESEVEKSTFRKNILRKPKALSKMQPKNRVQSEGAP